MNTIVRIFSFLWRRLAQSWLFMWQGKRRFLTVAGVVAIPSAMIRSYQSLTVDFSLVLFIASIYCVLSLIVVCRDFEGTKSQKIGAIYTKASGRFLQALGVTLIQALALLPALLGMTLGLFVVSFGLTNFYIVPAVILGLMSVYLLGRLAVALYIAAVEEATIRQSMIGSWQRTKGKTLRIVSRYIVLFAVIILATVGIFSVVNVAPILAQSWLVQGAVSAVLVTISLPWLVIFGYSIYDETSR